jgi:type I restriction enzyme M protein
MPPKTTPEKANGKRHASQQSLNGTVKSICDIMRRSNCAGALQYVPELTWILLLRILDEQERPSRWKASSASGAKKAN